MEEKSHKINFITVFFSVFIAAGLALLIWGLVRTFDFLLATETPATVISTEYNHESREAEIVFSYEEDGAIKTAKLKIDEFKYNQEGRLPYYEGDETVIRLSGAGEVVQFTTATILLLVGGGAFTLAGGGFLYFCCIRKHGIFDAVYDYELAMIPPEEALDETGKTEAYADELAKLPQSSWENKAGLARVWKRRLGDRLKTFTVWQHILFVLYFLLCAAAFVVWTALSVRKYTVGMAFLDLSCGFFAGVLLGAIGKAVYSLYFKILFKCGKFCEKQIATVECCAFESESSVMGSELGRKYIANKKFRVVARVNGKRSVGYVYGNVPPPQGAKLRVLVRKKHYGRFVLDISEQPA
ncbi:MAG: hypothetical protein K2G44_05145 [Clostridia bacterium]|nr:hypothetical protein [Clostridia bacterium]